MSQIRFNYVQNDGEGSSVSVFIGRDCLLATREHPNFLQIVARLEAGEDDPDTVRALFDVGVRLIQKFSRLSERVTVATGKLFFDGDEMNNELAQAILRFNAEGNEDFNPLVNFLEKIEQNPNPHSRDHLFRWLKNKSFGICPDGDFIAYKGVHQNDNSSNSGTAIVNGETVKGQIPNKADTIIEMPRSQVMFDPAQGCSTGLHAGNWGYASSFVSGGKVLRVKINPRDVVSVPVDSSEQKLRVCRYKVMNVVKAQDKELLYVPDYERTAKVPVKPVKPEPKAKKEPAESAPKGKRTVQTVYPEYYEQFKKNHFETCTQKELAWLAKEWEIEGATSKTKKEELVAALVKEARARLKTWDGPDDPA